MSESIASITTLTASVQVVMMDARQVTLSVARQLDSVPAHTIVPFGRIRMRAGGPAWKHADLLEVIGTDWTGTLVTAETERYTRSGRLSAWNDLPLIVLAGSR